MSGTNYLAHVTYRLDIPCRRAERIVGRAPSDDSDCDWYAALEDALGDNPDLVAEFVSDDPDVEVGVGPA